MVEAFQGLPTNIAILEMVFNVKAARALRLTIPEALLVRTDRLIEE